MIFEPLLHTICSTTAKSTRLVSRELFCDAAIFAANSANVFSWAVLAISADAFS